MKRLLPALPLLLLAVLFFQRQHSPDAEPDPATVREGTAVKPTGDWTAITRELESGTLSGRVDETSAYGRYLQSLEALDGRALVAEWEQLQSAGLPESVREQLETILLGHLLRKDVELALVRFANHVGDADGGTGSQLFGGFRDLAERLPMKAGQWLDQNAAEGTFGTEANPKLSGDVPVRISYERELIRSLLGSNPAQAEGRLTALPEGWRTRALQGGDSPRSIHAYATLVRKYMTPEQQEQEFLRMATSAAYHEGSEGVDKLLERIGATEAEREVILRRTAADQGASGR